MVQSNNNLWILTEERLKISVLKIILNTFVKFTNGKIIQSAPKSEVKIKPVFEKKKFKNLYQIENFKIKNIDKIYSLIVSGTTSFTDHLLFEQKEKPSDFELSTNNIKFAFEDTKTDSTESRNTVFGQRGSKHVILSYYNKNIPFKVIITDSEINYNDKFDKNGNIIEKGFPPSSKFDARCLVTSGVEIIGINNFDAAPFKDFEELKSEKNKMRKPGGKNNIAFKIENISDGISLSKKLLKPGKNKVGKITKNWSDPSIGQVLSTSLAIRKLGYDGNIKIVKHQLDNEMIKNKNNKFLLGCKSLKINLENLNLPNVQFPRKYWEYPTFSDSEKHATILFHHMLNYSQNLLRVIFDNHGGCARSYITTIDQKNFPVPKQLHESKLPDLIVLDKDEKKIYMIEGKTHIEYKKGIDQIKLFSNFFDDFLVKKCGYKNYELESWIILSGDSNLDVDFKKVIFNLREDFSIEVSNHINDKFLNIFNNFS